MFNYGKNAIRFLIFCVVVTLCKAEDVGMQSSLVVGSHIDLDTFKADRPDFSSNNEAFVATVDKELNLLKDKFGTVDVDLKDSVAAQIAPTICALLVDGVAEIVRQANLKGAGMTVPGVKLSFRVGSLQYNAAAEKVEQIVAKKTRTYLEDSRGNRKLVDEKVEVETNKISDIVVGAQLVRLFVWMRDGDALLIAILGHEIGHIIFDHSSEDVRNEHEADLFAAMLLKNGVDLIKALDVLALAAHTYNTLKDIVSNKQEVYDFIRAAVNRVVLDLVNLDELGNATSHSYVATVIHNAVRKEASRINKAVSSSNREEACYALYEALKRACNAPDAVFGVSAQQIKRLCAKMEKKSRYLEAFKQTHPTPFNRRVLIEAISRR